MNKSFTCLVQKDERLNKKLIEFAKSNLVIGTSLHEAADKYGEVSMPHLRDVFSDRADVNWKNIKSVRYIIKEAEKSHEQSLKLVKELQMLTTKLVA